MKLSELTRLESTLSRLKWENELTRVVREIPARMEKHLEQRATELSAQGLQAVTEKLEVFRKELDRAMASAQAALDAEAVMVDPAKVPGMIEQMGGRIDSALASKREELVKAMERHFQGKEAAFIEQLDRLSKDYAQKREAMVKEFEARTVTPILADTYRGNWKADQLYRRGETFSFRGGWHLVLQDARGQMPGNATLRGPAPVYALLAAPGAPGPAGLNGTGGGGGDSQYVTPPLLSAGSTRGQWTYSSGYMYWAVANGTVIRWAVVSAP